MENEEKPKRKRGRKKKDLDILIDGKNVDRYRCHRSLCRIIEFYSNDSFWKFGKVLNTNNVIILMGVLAKGFYTRGNKTTAEIAALTDMSPGDTVFDTDRKERRVYDGTNWVTGNQISLLSRGQTPGGSNQLQGAVSIIADQDFSVQSGISTTNDENVIGAIQGPVGASFSVGSYVILQYRGMGYVANLNAGVPGQYVTLSTTRGRANSVATSSVGTFGVWCEPVTASTVGRAMIQPIEIN